MCWCNFFDFPLPAILTKGFLGILGPLCVASCGVHVLCCGVHGRSTRIACVPTLCASLCGGQISRAHVCACARVCVCVRQRVCVHSCFCVRGAGIVSGPTCARLLHSYCASWHAACGASCCSLLPWVEIMTGGVALKGVPLHPRRLLLRPARRRHMVRKFHRRA